MRNPKILVVEDEDLIRLTLAEALADAGFDVVEAGSGDEALLLLQAQNGFRLLLTDIHLPGLLDGLALAEEVRRSEPAMPVIYMTGRPDCAVLGPRDGVDRLIAKPYRLAEVCAAARRMTGG